jgi:hypothetical protein
MIAVGGRPGAGMRLCLFGHGKFENIAVTAVTACGGSASRARRDRFWGSQCPWGRWWPSKGVGKGSCRGLRLAPAGMGDGMAFPQFLQLCNQTFACSAFCHNASIFSASNPKHSDLGRLEFALQDMQKILAEFRVQDITNLETKEISIRTQSACALISQSLRYAGNLAELAATTRCSKDLKDFVRLLDVWGIAYEYGAIEARQESIRMQFIGNVRAIYAARELFHRLGIGLSIEEEIAVQRPLSTPTRI